MPIRPEDQKRYPDNWHHIADAIKVGRADRRCECAGECGNPSCAALKNGGRCGVQHGSTKVMQVTTVNRRKDEAHVTLKETRVVLTVAHLDHTPEHCWSGNLKAMCQLCHLSYDKQHHATTARKTRETKRGQLTLQLEA